MGDRPSRRPAPGGPRESAVAAITNALAELKEALADLDRLPVFDAGTVSFAAHALTNYLMVCAATTDLLLDALGDHPNAEARTCLEALQQVTSLMQHTVNQLMNTSVTAEPRLKFDWVDLGLLSRRGCGFYQQIADAKQIRIECDAGPNMAIARTDRVAVAAVLDNLLSNAIKYTPTHGCVRVTVVDEGGHAVCRVCDSGPGLTEADRAKLFQKGVRLSSVPTGGEPSTGYGLAVAKELIDRLGGEIWCDSRLGEGACFAFRLPAG